MKHARKIPPLRPALPWFLFLAAGYLGGMSLAESTATDPDNRQPTGATAPGFPERVGETARPFVDATREGAPLAAAPPNVVILFTDDQGTLDANCFGSGDLATPNIDKLAATGVRFTQAYAHTVCCPARAALLTGRHPQRSGVTDWMQGNMIGPKGRNMPLDEVTLAEVLRDAGYRTALFGKWHLGADKDHGPMKQGFDEYFGIRGGFIDNFNHHFLHGSGFHDLYEGTAEVRSEGDYFPQMITGRALAFIDRNRRRPFFLYLAFNLPHYPEQPLAGCEEPYKDMKDPARRSYAAAVTTADHHIGLVLDRLETHGLRENTIVVFMSDNGHSEEDFMRIKGDSHASGLPDGHFYGASGAGNTGKWTGHKATFLEGGIRVPAIITFPAKLPKGEARGQIITAMDWFPTILELCGIGRGGSNPPLDGHSLLPLIASPAATSSYGKVLHFAWRDQWMAREGDWKLIGKVLPGSSTPKLTLHRLSDEMPEVMDHANDQPQVVARLRAMHEKWLAEVTP
jgi:arylsulfatase A-like enzyme